MNLTQYLNGMRAATTADELETAIHAPFKHPFHGRTWRRICNVRDEVGRNICAAHPNGRYVPLFGAARQLQVCDQSYKVGHGQNSTGIRYIWTDAWQWAERILRGEGFSRRAAHDVCDGALKYPHRKLAIVADALSGNLPDPPLNRLIYSGNTIAGPVRVNRRLEKNTRAHRRCKCGGWRWDWGCGWTGYCWVINWYCDRCTRIYVEYVDDDRLAQIRQTSNRG